MGRLLVPDLVGSFTSTSDSSIFCMLVIRFFPVSVLKGYVPFALISRFHRRCVCKFLEIGVRSETNMR